MTITAPAPAPPAAAPVARRWRLTWEPPALLVLALAAGLLYGWGDSPAVKSMSESWKALTSNCTAVTGSTVAASGLYDCRSG